MLIVTKRLDEPTVIFLSFTFLCLLLSLQTLLTSPPLSLPSSSSSFLFPFLSSVGWQDKRSGIAAYILPLSPQTLTLHTLYCPRLPLSYQLISGCRISNECSQPDSCLRRFLGAKLVGKLCLNWFCVPSIYWIFRPEAEIWNTKWSFIVLRAEWSSVSFSYYVFLQADKPDRPEDKSPFQTSVTLI